MQKPNIILLNIDDLGYGDIGCYGSKLNRTPHIDKLAEEGILFTDFYAAAPVCTPSRAGLMTGCYPKRIDFQSFGVYDSQDPQKKKDDFVVLMPGQPEGLNPKEKTIAGILKDAGYATQMIGKWHLGDQKEYSPLHFGFDHYFGIPYSNDMGLMPVNDFWSRYHYTMCPLPLVRDDKLIEEQPDCASLAERFTVEAVDFIRDHSEQPFFLYFAHYYVHNPLYTAERFQKVSENGQMGAALASIDWTVSMIEYELERLGLSDNTLIIFMSDNGGDTRSCNAPLRGYKGSTFEGGERVNCIMKWPEIIKRGRVSNEIVSMMDIFPTFAEIVGVSIDDGIKRDGISVLDLLIDEKQHSKRNTFFYYAANELQAVRKGDYKLHLKTGELYDLRKDVGETTDIAHQYPEKAAELEQIAQLCREDIGDSATGTIGKNCRPKGFVKDFKPMTCFDPENPYMIALYD
ncbi:Arylsulfatase [uncultured Ruminococcus sp.]|uniref:sulfatase family protein n=1 Tax=Massiliimalia timonensis TaxID=1987501 RepID=UPI000820E4D8|nr:sulfatase [Massiliimalia timonensis]SCH52763.1 Arylsulfatase [uncultured Clostridium sp.]SCH63081.1 Arylsulfatase [uncultured Ruminococcus sp.]